MPTRFASAKNSIAECDRCGFRYKLKELRTLIVKTKRVNLLVCGSCWEKDHPQLRLGMYPVNDPQAVRNPRPDNSYLQAGLTGLQLTNDDFGTPSGGSRDIQWGWGPVGLNNPLGLFGLTDALEGTGEVGSVTVSIS
jgi:hypothetical protein